MMKLPGRRTAVPNFCTRASDFAMNPRASALLAVCAALFVSGASFAGPGEDALARVSELNKIIQTQSERIAKLEAQLQNQGLLGLLNQVEALKTDVARLRGAQEEQAHRLETADKRTKDLFGDLDERLKEVASRPVAASTDAIRLQPSQALVVAAVPPVVSSDAEAKAYEVAHALIKAGKYKEAIAAFQAFVSRYPSGPLAANALYWIGFSQFSGLSDFHKAAESYQRLLKDFPTSPKVPDALFSLARTQVQLDDKEAARTTLNQLLAKHPTSKAAENGKKLLATLN
jgi:tol-pal system protein YbgF